MEKLFEKWRSINFITRITIVLVIGTLLGLLFPNIQVIGLVGELFVSALKVIAPILVFVLVVSALAGAKAKTSISLIVVLYAISTFAAAVIAAIASFAFPVDLTLVAAVAQDAPSGIGEVLKNLLNDVVVNPLTALATANYLGILAWAILLGIALRYSNDTTKTVLANISSALATIVRWVIALSPIGVLGLMYTAVSTSGLIIFSEYGKLLLVLVGAMAFVALIANPLIVFSVLRQNPYPLVLQCLKESGFMAFFTRSSAANIPVNLELCRRLGLDRDTYAVSIPLGAAVNLAGAAVTITVMSIAAAHTMGIAIDLPTAVILCVLTSIAAASVSGVPGGSLLLIPLACSLFNIDNDVAMQVVAIGFIIGVIQDSCETAINSSSDVLFTATAEYRTRQKAGKSFRVELSPPTLAHTLPELEGADNW
jgi:serine/threonine transporter